MQNNNQQRKILEDLQQKKLKQGASQALNVQTTASQQPMGWQSGTDGFLASNSQKTSLLPTNSSTFGYFIQQESPFGNSILPVLPRVDKI